MSQSRLNHAFLNGAWKLRYTVGLAPFNSHLRAHSMSRPHGLSKSRFISGLQCHRQLWWRVHEPASPELVPDAARQAVFDNGTRVGEVARGYVPGGVLIDLPHADYDGKREATQQALASAMPAIYEASFVADHGGG